MTDDLFPDPLAQFTEEVSCWNLVARLKELEAHGHFVPRMKVLVENKGYELTVMPGVLGTLNKFSESPSHDPRSKPSETPSF